MPSRASRPRRPIATPSAKAATTTSPIAPIPTTCSSTSRISPRIGSLQKEGVMFPALKACAAALALMMFASAASAQDTVRIGNETKRAFGTVTALSAGDVACYVTLRDDRGAPFEEMALFEICEQPGLVGKRV